MSILDRVNSPVDLKELNNSELTELCADIREFLVENVSKTGGHLASNLGVVELTVAIHKVFDTSVDRLCFDVGHQCYVHKILTGRKDKFSSLRSFGGISGFPKPEESVHDACIAGHASNSISVALGMARARTKLGQDHKCIALIGDGALTGGLSDEALSDAGCSGEDIIVILNDNGMSIDRSVGGISRTLSRMHLKPGYINFKRRYRNKTKRTALGRWIYSITHKIKTTIKNLVFHCSMFEDMGFQYLGPVDGHDIDRLTNMLAWAKEQKGPTLVHVKTVKGKGYEFSENDPDAYHGVASFDPQRGVEGSQKDTFSSVFGKKLEELARENEKIIAVTAAMSSGTGLAGFAEKFPNRFIDVGIAEGHAVTMCAGAAAGGLIPVFAVYSTFLQRGFDMLIHDTAISDLHTVFAVDRAGIVGSDGETHQGVFDVSYLTSIPGMTVLCPSSHAELCDMLSFAVNNVKGPVAVRYPRGSQGRYTAGGIKPSKLIKEGKDLTIVTYGISVNTAIDAAEMLESEGISAEILKLDFIAPIDMGSIVSSVMKTRKLLVLEEAVKAGCIGEKIAAHLAEKNIYLNALILKNLGSAFVPQGTYSELCRAYKIDTKSVAEAITGICR